MRSLVKFSLFFGILLITCVHKSDVPADTTGINGTPSAGPKPADTKAGDTKSTDHTSADGKDGQAVDTEGPAGDKTTAVPSAAPLPSASPETPSATASNKPDGTADDDAPDDDPDTSPWKGMPHVMEFDDRFIELLSKSPPPEVNPHEETIKDFDEESKGTYKKTEKKLSACAIYPIKEVWRNFAPFFNYKYDENFLKFAALFLSIWQQESLFTMPSQGVHVQPNCKHQKAILVRPLAGVNLTKDLAKISVKDHRIKKHYGKHCHLLKADYGPLQWNYKWRLTDPTFRKDIKKALLLSTQYREKDVKKLTQKQMANLIKYNAKALFLLAGLSLRKAINRPVTTIHNYNAKKSYFKRVNEHRKTILDALKAEKTCLLK